MLFGSMGELVFEVARGEKTTYVAGRQCLVEKKQKKKSVGN